jgi:DinB superfamily
MNTTLFSPPSVAASAEKTGHRRIVDVDPSGREVIHEELERTRATVHQLVANASPNDMRRLSAGTRWTNEQLLFHMVFGYLVVRALLPLVRAFGHLPDAASRWFARALQATTPGFHVFNYLGSCAGAHIFRGSRLAAQADRVTAALHRHLDRESDEALLRGMYFPISWDPFFRDRMTLREVYRYGTRHFDFHRGQLTL